MAGGADPVAVIASIGATGLADLDVRTLAEAPVPATWWRVAETPEQATAHAARALELGMRRVVAVGGDGTVQAITEAVPEDRSDVELGVVPMGTANDLADQLGLCGRPLAEALRLALLADAAPMDLGTCDDRRFANLVTLGPGSRMTIDTPRALKDVLGAAAYLLHGITHLSDVRPFAATVRVDGRTIEDEFLGVYVCNGGQAGGGFAIAPDARIDDGMLDLVLVPAQPLLNFANVALTGSVEQTRQDGLVEVVRTRGPVEIVGEQPIPASLDGEPLQADRFRFGVRHHALRIVADPSAARPLG